MKKYVTYQDYLKAMQTEINDLPIFAAFSNERLEKALAERNATIDDIYALPGVTGTFYLKKDSQVIVDFFNREDDLAECMKDHDFAVGAFYYEMCNHEYGINSQGAWDVLNCFSEDELDYYIGDGYKYGEYLRAMGHPEWIPWYKEAREQYFKDAEEHEWF